jgi:peptidoglycan/LPS O-acetylase OafA/YrhL
MIRPGSGHYDWHYLVFLQNYLPYLSLFNVSWSLCVEEHFYLIFPLLVSLVLIRTKKIEWLFGLLLFAPMALRWVTQPVGRFDEFAYPYYASQLHFEALIAGIWASWLHQYRPARWTALQAQARRWLFVMPTLFLLIIFLPEPFRYRLAFWLAAVGFVWWLIAWVERSVCSPASIALLRPVALTAFSAYLTHMFAIHAAIRLVRLAGTSRWTEVAYYGVAGIAIATVTAIFYRLVEQPVQTLRHRLVPARTA